MWRLTEPNSQKTPKISKRPSPAEDPGEGGATGGGRGLDRSTSCPTAPRGRLRRGTARRRGAPRRTPSLAGDAAPADDRHPGNARPQRPVPRLCFAQRPRQRGEPQRATHGALSRARGRSHGDSGCRGALCTGDRPAARRGDESQPAARSHRGPASNSSRPAPHSSCRRSSGRSPAMMEVRPR